MTNVVILAANDATDPDDAGYPVCLTEFGNSTLLETVSNQVATIDNSKLVIALREGDVRKWHLEDLVKNFKVPSSLFSVAAETAGATCTALLVTASMEPDEPLLVLNGNEHLAVDFAAIIKEFEETNVDAGVVYFDSLHPRYSYARLDDNGLVLETAEKRPISRNATVGFYWFRQASVFTKNAARQLLKRADVDHRYYICPVMNEVILAGGLVKAVRIESSQFVPLKTRRQLSNYGQIKDHT